MVYPHGISLQSVVENEISQGIYRARNVSHYKSDLPITR